MKHQLEEVGKEEQKTRVVKKARVVEPPSWNVLPNDIQAMIVKEMDIKTSVLFKECGWKEHDLVQNHTKYLVDIDLYFWYGKMNIKLVDENTRELQLEWKIRENLSGGAKVELIIDSSVEPRVVILRSKTVATATSMILRRLLTEPRFKVYELELQLMNYNQKIDLDSIRANVDLLTLFNCLKMEPVFSVLQNKNINFKEVVGVQDDDRQMLYEIDCLNYGQPQTLHASSTFPMDRDGSYCSFLFERCVFCFEDAKEWLKKFWDVTLGHYSFANKAAVNKKLKSKKIVENIMLLRVAYYYDDDCVPYIQGDAWTEDEEIANPFSDRIAFLEDGIDQHLSDYQLTILSIAYLVRLFRNEPEIEKIYDIAFEDLRSVLKKYENVNLYEKLVAKLEALIP